MNIYDIKPHFSFDKKDYTHFIDSEIYKIPYLLNKFLIKKNKYF